MRVMVTGVQGQLGYDVVRRLNELGIPNKGIDIDSCDLTDPMQVTRTVAAYKPDCIVHCAAYTAVEKAEQNEDVCRCVNVDGTRNVAQACAMVDASMVYISTDYVFSGEGNRPFETDDRVAPQNVYAKTKYEGELEVQRLLKKHFIIRSSWIFGLHGHNFVKTILRIAREKQEIRVVDDQIGSPTYTRDLAALLCEMIQTTCYGVYHATNENYCSWYEFARMIITCAGLNCTITPVSTAAYNAGVKRPLNSRLSKRSLLDAGFNLLPTWQDALERYYVELKEFND